MLFDQQGNLAKRALIYDPKLEFYPTLRGMGVPAEQICVLHPLDDRCRAWDVAKDIDDPVSVRQLAATLCPPEKNDANRYFTDAARDILTAAINCLRKAAVPEGKDETRSRWTFNDIIEATSSPTILEQVLKLEQSGRDAIATHLERDERTAGSVLSTLRSRIAQYENVGALWVDRPLQSLVDWVQSPVPSILLLPTDEKHRETLDPINRALFRRASELVLSRPDKPDKEVWFFLDELRLAGRFDGLADLLLKGRSKGARCVVGFQSIEGLHEVYGENGADDLLGQCGNKAFLRLDSPQCMQWASRYFAEHEYMQITDQRGQSYSGQGSTYSESQSRTLSRRATVMPIEFREFRTANRAHGIDGAFVVPSFRGWMGTIPPKFVTKHAGKPSKHSDDVGFDERDKSHQERRVWTPADYKRFHITPPSAPKTKIARTTANETTENEIQEMED